MSNPYDPYFLLLYTYSDEYLEKRGLYRKEHVDLTTPLVEQGSLILGGATDNPPDRAVLCFQCPDRSVVEDFVRNDPYVRNGLVLDHEIRDWKVLVGTACRDPIDPENL